MAEIGIKERRRRNDAKERNYKEIKNKNVI